MNKVKMMIRFYTIKSIFVNMISSYLPFMTIEFKKECSELLKSELIKLDLVGDNSKIDIDKFLAFIIG